MYIYPHNIQWASEYTQESKAIILSYGAGLKLHHIGSTAVKGLYAKDCIDVLGIVSSLSEVQTKKESFIRLGYSYKGEHGINGREYFSKLKRKVHLHIFETGDINIARHLNFLSIMKSTPALVAKLNNLKNHLHNKYPDDKESYQKEKVCFYNKTHKML